MGYSSRENRLCCPKHAPLEKVKRSSKTMFCFLLINFLIIASLVFFIIYIFNTVKNTDSMVDDFTFLGQIELIVPMNSMEAFFVLSVIAFFIVNCRDPGYTKAIKFSEFYVHLD